MDKEQLSSLNRSIVTFEDEGDFYWNDVIMPPIGLAIGNVDFKNLFVTLKEGATQAGPYATLADAQKAGAVTINVGTFITSIITFTIVAFAVFLLVRAMNRLKGPAPAPKA